jgi:hypothetical protein
MRPSAPCRGWAVQALARSKLKSKEMRQHAGFEQTPVARQCVNQVVDVAARMIRVQLNSDPRSSERHRGKLDGIDVKTYLPEVHGKSYASVS